MKLILIGAFLLLSVSQKKCTRSPPRLPVSNCFKGKLEIKGICSNYTIKLIEGNIDSSKIDAFWTDETTKKQYTNVFALGSPCTFPSTIETGDQFYFTVDTSATQDCAVCMAWYPHPQKALKIKVLSGPCK